MAQGQMRGRRVRGAPGGVGRKEQVEGWKGKSRETRGRQQRGWVVWGERQPPALGGGVHSRLNPRCSHTRREPALSPAKLRTTRWVPSPLTMPPNYYSLTNLIFQTGTGAWPLGAGSVSSHRSPSSNSQPPLPGGAIVASPRCATQQGGSWHAHRAMQ